jgi:(p)ppGpp synthase/HD superfamily hydrolase
MSTLNVDLYPEEVYTFTPRGRVIVLPRDATPIDFAYAIHSDVGNTCVGAKVNGRIVPLRYTLRNGDIVEIMTQANHLPSKDWLSIVKTSRARNKIKHVINTTERVKAIEIGEKYLEKEARRLGVHLNKITKAELERVAGADTAKSRIPLRLDTASIRRDRCCRTPRPPSSSWQPGRNRSRERPSAAVDRMPRTTGGTATGCAGATICSCIAPCATRSPARRSSATLRVVGWSSTPLS